jgi:hypothetical protein
MSPPSFTFSVICSSDTMSSARRVASVRARTSLRAIAARASPTNRMAPS